MVIFLLNLSLLGLSSKFSTVNSYIPRRNIIKGVFLQIVRNYYDYRCCKDSNKNLL